MTPLWKRANFFQLLCWFSPGVEKHSFTQGFLLKAKFLMYMKWVHESLPQMTKPSYDDSHKHDPKLYRSLGDDPTVTNQQKSPTVTRYQPLKMSQQTHGIPKKERPRMTKRQMLRSSPKAGQKGTNIFPMIQMYRDHWLTRWWQLKNIYIFIYIYIFKFSPRKSGGFMIQFDLRIFFKWVGLKPPTSK